MFASHTDPIAGWKILLSHDYDNLKPSIKDDYTAYPIFPRLTLQAEVIDLQ